VRVVLRLEDGVAVGRGASRRIEHLPTRRSFGVFVNLLVGSLGLLDFYTKLLQLQVVSLVTWLVESVNLFWARLPVPPQFLLPTLPTLVARRSNFLPHRIRGVKASFDERSAFQVHFPDRRNAIHTRGNKQMVFCCKNKPRFASVKRSEFYPPFLKSRLVDFQHKCPSVFD
jgi:hypothetical protein